MIVRCQVLIISIFFAVLSENQIVANECKSAKNGKRYNDPDACEKYRICLNRETSTNECPYGFFYNHPKEICSDPKLINETDSCHLKNLCQNKQNGHRLAHPNCEWYYLCMNRLPVLEHCPKGMFLNLKKNICSLPQFIEGECGVTPKLCENQPDGTSLPHAECDKFYFCYSNEEVVRYCKDGLHFNPKLKFCQEPAEAKCTGLRCMGQPDGALYPHILCDNFYFCYKNRDYVKTCKTGLHFNPVLKYCEEPHEAGCVTNRCFGKTDGSLQPHEDCGKFYFCYNSNQFIKHCKKGLHFDATFKYCQSPTKAACN